VKATALELGLPVFQPKSWKTEETISRIEKAGADGIVVVAYGRLLPQRVLDAARYGSVNVHASLLPKLRGAAPVQWAIARGETETGITTQRMALSLDAGDILEQATEPIYPSDTTPVLLQRLCHLGQKLLLQTLERLPDPRWGTPQEESEATFAPPLRREDGILDPVTQDAQTMHNKVRAFSFEPGAVWKDFRILETALEPGTGLPAGSVHNQGILVGADSQNLRILRLQAPGKKPMAFQEYVRGNVFHDN
jgi:methionyl-tRNA formyltransferase